MDAIGRPSVALRSPSMYQPQSVRFSATSDTWPDWVVRTAQRTTGVVRHQSHLMAEDGPTSWSTDYLEKGAARGNVSECIILAERLIEGRDMPEDWDRAKALYEQAAKKSHIGQYWYAERIMRDFRFRERVPFAVKWANYWEKSGKRWPTPLEEKAFTLYCRAATAIESTWESQDASVQRDAMEQWMHPEAVEQLKQALPEAVDTLA